MPILPVAGQNKKEAAVIGSGFGGIAAAIRLQASGFKTTLFESRDRAGGRAYRYEIDGYSFDAGPTVITVPDTIEELFQICGKDMNDYVTLMPVEPYYRLYWEDGKQFDYSQHSEKLREQIKALAPDDLDGYDRFCAYAEQVYEKGYKELCHVPFLKFTDMLKVAPDLIKLQAYRSVYSTVSKFVKNEKMRQVLSFNSLLIGGNPFQASAIYTLIHPLEKKFGVWFPKGGTHALIMGLIKLFEDMGGKLLLNTPVEEIITDQHTVTGVRTHQGIHSCNAVVSNGDVHQTYKQLLAREPKAKTKAWKVGHMRHSMSLFVMHFGTNKKFPNLVHHNILLGNRYRGLLDDIFHNGVLAEDFSLYLHAPGRSDPSLAPEGGESFYVLSPVPNLKKLPEDWDKIGQIYGDRILKALEDQVMPGLRDSIVVKKIFTPKDFENELGAYQGAAFSLEPTLTQSAWFRTHNRDSRIKGLYFVGAGTHPGAGVPGVIGSAKATASVLLEDYGLQQPDFDRAVIPSQFPAPGAELTAGSVH